MEQQLQNLVAKSFRKRREQMESESEQKNYVLDFPLKFGINDSMVSHVEFPPLGKIQSQEKLSIIFQNDVTNKMKSFIEQADLYQNFDINCRILNDDQTLSSFRFHVEKLINVELPSQGVSENMFFTVHFLVDEFTPVEWVEKNNTYYIKGELEDLSGGISEGEELMSFEDYTQLTELPVVGNNVDKDIVYENEVEVEVEVEKKSLVELMAGGKGEFDNSVDELKSVSEGDKVIGEEE